MCKVEREKRIKKGTHLKRFQTHTKKTSEGLEEIKWPRVGNNESIGIISSHDKKNIKFYG